VHVPGMRRLSSPLPLSCRSILLLSPRLFLSSVSRLLPPIFLRSAVHNLCGNPCGEDRRGHGLWEREEDLGRELFRRWKRTIMLPRRRRLRRAVGGNVDIARRRLIPETQASIIYQTSISRVGGRRLRPGTVTIQASRARPRGAVDGDGDGDGDRGGKKKCGDGVGMHEDGALGRGVGVDSNERTSRFLKGVDGVFGLRPIDVGTSTGLRVGQGSLAIGSPFGLGRFVCSVYLP
jgi:hypothetical protein